jgi:hypothetical protein
VEECYDNFVTLEEGTDVTVSAGAATTGISAQLDGYGTMAGTVYADDGVSPLDGIAVAIYERTSTPGLWQLSGSDSTDAAGSYSVDGLVTRDYRLRFADPIGQFATEWYDDAPSIGSATDVRGNLGGTVSGIDASLGLATMTATVPLVGGWNLVSPSLDPTDPAPADALASITGTYQVIWGWEGCDAANNWKKYDPELPVGNDLETVEGAMGYWLDMDGPASLSVGGTRSLTTTVTLCPGWNLIGYPAGSAKPVTEVLAPIAGKYSIVYGYDASDAADPWEKYDPSFPVGNDLTHMRPGFGYWISMTQGAELGVYSR